MAGGAAHLGDDAQHIGPVHGGSVRGQQFLRGHNHRPLQAVKAARGRPLQNAQQAQLHVGKVCRALADPCVRRVSQHGAVVFIHLLYRPLRRPLLALDAREDLLIHHFIVQDIHVRLEDGGHLLASSRAHMRLNSTWAVCLAASYRARCSSTLPPCAGQGGAGTNGS